VRGSGGSEGCRKDEIWRKKDEYGCPCSAKGRIFEAEFLSRSDSWDRSLFLNMIIGSALPSIFSAAGLDGC
jgi:hypothetical protein